MSAPFNAATLPPIEQAAREEYEYYGSTLTTNTALKVITLILSLVIAVLGFALLRATNAALKVKPLVIRVNEVGRADAVAYEEFIYKPQAPEIRYFLTQFTVDYYSRNHQTVAERYVEALYFLDWPLFSGLVPCAQGWTLPPEAPQVPLNFAIVAATRRREPAIDFRSAVEAGLEGLPDPDLLDQTAQDGRVLITHDRRTMPGHFRDHPACGKHSPGVLIVAQFAPIAPIVECLILIWSNSDPDVWQDQIHYLPSLSLHRFSR